MSGENGEHPQNSGPRATSWGEVVRLRTLPAAVAPVILGAGAAAAMGELSVLRSLLAAGVALALQIGCNLANDYSDGVRGTDDDRTGPPRLTASGQVAPHTVKLAAFGCFGIGALLGLALVVLSGQWWLLAVGAAAIAAAWFYTGGSHPYGYAGLGEIFVFVFFGLVATVGTTYVQAGTVPGWLWPSACGIGLLACSLPGGGGRPACLLPHASRAPAAGGRRPGVGARDRFGQPRRRRRAHQPSADPGHRAGGAAPAPATGAAGHRTGPLRRPGARSYCLPA